MRVGGEWSLGRILMEPLFYNPHLAGWWGAAVLDASSGDLSQRLANEDTQWRRYTEQRKVEGKEVYDRGKRWAAYGITHVCHLVNSSGNLLSWAGFHSLGAQRGLNRGLVPPKSEFDALKASLPKIWLDELPGHMRHPKR